MTWAISDYSKSEVNRAGRILIAPDPVPEEFNHAMDVMSSWRSAHAYPMRALLMTLRKKAAEIDGNAIVVQRHKRAPSIINKLSRFPEMELSRMHDIGGCRAILPTVEEVRRLSDNIQDSRVRHRLHRVYDYINSPKESGYRGIHLSYKYNGEKAEYNGYFVELQLRSKIQHAWATAVEIVDTFTKQALKSNQGKQTWLDFFRMASAEFAKLESCPVGAYVDGIDTNLELRRLESRLNVLNRLNAFTVSAQYIHEISRSRKAAYFILELAANKAITVTEYTSSQLSRATFDYLLREKSLKDSPGADVVLVSASSVQSLRNAYPNYFIDSTEFVTYVQRALEG